MRQLILSLIVFAATFINTAAAERISWSKIRFVGGTIPVKASPFDFNTTLTLTANPDSIVITIAPAKAFASIQTVRIDPSQVTYLGHGPAAFRRVAEVAGSQVPAKKPSLFGLLDDRVYLGIVYQVDNGKPAAVLLDSLYTFRILSALKLLTGKEVEGW